MTPQVSNDATVRGWQQRLRHEQDLLSARARDQERVLWLSAEAGWHRPSDLCLYLSGADLRGDLRADAASWPLRDDCFDHVILHHATECVAPDLAQSLVAEAVRVLKPERCVSLLLFTTWTRFRFGWWREAGAPRWTLRSGRFWESRLQALGCVEIDIRAVSPGPESLRLSPQRPWSSGLLIEARKRREIDNVHRLRRAARSLHNTGGLVGQPSARQAAA